MTQAMASKASFNKDVAGATYCLAFGRLAFR